MFRCNCQKKKKKKNCPLNGECLTSQLLYRATVTNAVNEYMKKNNSLADCTFKERQSNHKRDFKSEILQLDKISQICVELNKKNIAPIIKWEILRKVYGHPKQNKRSSG